MKFSHTVIYAINAMLYLAEAEAGVPVPCRQIARDGKMPERFLLQVLRTLVTRGLLHSTRGVEGGYHLARSPFQITLCDIVDAFENPLQAKMPQLDCSSELTRERVLDTLRHATGAARAELEKMTLAQLTASPNNRPHQLEESWGSLAHHGE
jgi:Rrf2 family protein